jgi:ABC-2 type transport system ATP-binding protein
VVLVTHNVVEAERAVQRLVILDEGRVVAQGSPAELRGEHAERLRMELTAVGMTTAGWLAAQAVGVEPAVVVGRRVSFPIGAADAAGALAWAQRERAAGRVEEFSVTSVSLEDVYIRLVSTRTRRQSAKGADHASLAA